MRSPSRSASERSWVTKTPVKDLDGVLHLHLQNLTLLLLLLHA